MSAILVDGARGAPGSRRSLPNHLAIRLAVLLLALAALLAAAGCNRRPAATATQPVTENLAAYWTCAVAFVSDGRGADANEAFDFVPWFESRVRERGVFEPLARDEQSEAEVTLRLDATAESDDGDPGKVLLRVLVIDTKTKEEIGEIEAVGIAPVRRREGAPAAAATDIQESPRLAALRVAADKIIDFLKEKRRLSTQALAKRPPPPRPEAELPAAGVGPSSTCSTQCTVPAATSSSHEEQYSVSAGVTPLLRGLRECLDRVGGQRVDPAVLLRFGPDGRLRHVRIDVGGYEKLECVENMKSRPVRASTTRASVLRCEYRCTSS